MANDRGKAQKSSVHEGVVVCIAIPFAACGYAVVHRSGCPNDRGGFGDDFSRGERR